MSAHTHTVAFEGVRARLVQVECALEQGAPRFAIVGLPDKAVAEARDRVRAAMNALSIALPTGRITVNLSPADLPKEGSHFDLPIAIALMAALEAIPEDAANQILSLGELSLDGRLNPVPGALPAAMAAAEEDRPLFCPAASAPEAAWIDTVPVHGCTDLAQALRHLTGQTQITPASPGLVNKAPSLPDMRDVKGQERAKRALEIAAAGRHHLLFTGPPGAGKSMLAARLPGLLPPLEPVESLETAMVHSVAGELQDGAIPRHAPARAPHHTASMAALVGGGRGARPGEVSLAHNGVLFLDELPEFSRQVLDTLRQPLETGEVSVSRANRHVTYPCRFLLVAAANPCRCGNLGQSTGTCSRAPQCGEDYMGRISGPLLDRFDLRVELPPVTIADLDRPALGESTAEIAARVAAARALQAERYASGAVRLNSDLTGEVLDQYARPDAEGQALLNQVAEKMGLTARGYHRVLRVARTIADLDGSRRVLREHVAEAVSYRLPGKWS